MAFVRQAEPKDHDAMAHIVSAIQILRVVAIV